MNHNQFYQKNKNVWGGNPSQALQAAWKNFKSGNLFLDLGCGQGRDSLFMVKKGFKVTAVDSSEAAIKQLQKIVIQDNLTNLKAVCCDAARFEIEPNKYDIINSNNLLQFLSKTDALRLIKNIQEKIKPGGFVILSSFTVNDPLYQSADKKKLKTYFKPQEMRKLFKGFKIVHYLEDLIPDKGHGNHPQPHQHGVIRIVAQKV